MVMLVRPPGGREAGKASEIWELAKQGARMPGEWTVSPQTVLDAALAKDWPLCAYLAAVVATDKEHGQGPDSLAQPDERYQDWFWYTVVSPIVVEVQAEDRPRRSAGSGFCAGGVYHEGVLVGNGAATKSQRSVTSCFKPGATLQLGGQRMRRLKLEEQDILEVRRLFQAGEPADKEAARSAKDQLAAMARKAGSMYISGGRFRVMAYPLAGDKTKALLRPEAAAWTSEQKRAVRTVGESAIGQVVKARKWDIVEMMLRSGVPCPDLSREFIGLAGEKQPKKNDEDTKDEPAVQQWRSDILHTVGRTPCYSIRRGDTPFHMLDGNRPYTVLECAAWFSEEGSDTFRRVLLAMASGGHNLDLLGGRNAKPLIVAAAERQRWDIVQTVLELSTHTLDTDGKPVAALLAVEVGVEELKESPALRLATTAVHELLKVKEDESPVRAKNLTDYFRRVTKSEIVTHDHAPADFSLSGDGVYLERGDGMRLLSACLRLGENASSGKSRMLFLKVSEAEFERACKAASDSSLVLPVSLDKKRVQAKPPSEAGTCWLVADCPDTFVAEEEVRVPVNCSPWPSVTPLVPITVEVVSPCCNKRLAGAPVHINDVKVGDTGPKGEPVTCRVPVGTWRCGSAGLTTGFVMVTASPDEDSAVVPEDKVDATIVTDGAIFVYLQKNEVDEDDPDAEVFPDMVKLSANPADYLGSSECKFDSFAGKVRMNSRRARLNPRRIEPVVCLQGHMKCYAQLKSLCVSCDRAEFQPNDDLHGWFDTINDDNGCVYAEMFPGNPQRLGNAIDESRHQMADGGTPCSLHSGGHSTPSALATPLNASSGSRRSRPTSADASGDPIARGGARSGALAIRAQRGFSAGARPLSASSGAMRGSQERLGNRYGFAADALDYAGHSRSSGSRGPGLPRAPSDMLCSAPRSRRPAPGRSDRRVEDLLIRSGSGARPRHSYGATGFSASLQAEVNRQPHAGGRPPKLRLRDSPRTRTCGAHEDDRLGGYGFANPLHWQSYRATHLCA